LSNCFTACSYLGFGISYDKDGVNGSDEELTVKVLGMLDTTRSASSIFGSNSLETASNVAFI